MKNDDLLEMLYLYGETGQLPDGDDSQKIIPPEMATRTPKIITVARQKPQKPKRKQNNRYSVYWVGFGINAVIWFIGFIIALALIMGN